MLVYVWGIKIQFYIPNPLFPGSQRSPLLPYRPWWTVPWCPHCKAMGHALYLMTPEDLPLPGLRVEAAGTGLAAQREPAAFISTLDLNEHITIAVRGSPTAWEEFCFPWSSALKQTLHFPVNIDSHVSDTFIACLSSIKMFTSPKDLVLSSFHPSLFFCMSPMPPSLFFMSPGAG